MNIWQLWEIPWIGRFWAEVDTSHWYPFILKRKRGEIIFQWGCGYVVFTPRNWRHSNAIEHGDGGSDKD